VVSGDVEIVADCTGAFDIPVLVGNGEFVADCVGVFDFFLLFGDAELVEVGVVRSDAWKFI